MFSGGPSDQSGIAGFGGVFSLARPSIGDYLDLGRKRLPQVAHTSRLLCCVIFVPDFCAIYTISQGLLTMYFYNLKFGFTYTVSFQVNGCLFCFRG